MIRDREKYCIKQTTLNNASILLLSTSREDTGSLRIFAELFTMPEDINQGMSDLAFDPDQNPEEKRAVRRQYRSLARDLEGGERILWTIHIGADITI